LPNQTTTLSTGTINGADVITIELIQPDSMPAAVRIAWPAKQSIIPPTRFPAAAAEAARLFAEAATMLARIKASKRPVTGPACAKHKRMAHDHLSLNVPLQGPEFDGRPPRVGPSISGT
jgi:hypothetical protein